MSFLSKYKKEILLGVVMAAAGAVLFFAGAYLSGEKIPLPSFDQKEAVEEEKTAEDIPEEKPAGETGAEETPAPEVVNAGGKKETEESAAEAEKPEEKAQEEAAAEEEPAAPSVSDEEEPAAPESVQSGEMQEKEDADPEAEKRRAEGRFIGQIDAIIAAEDFWNAYPGQIPEGYDSRSGYTYDTYISKDPTPEEPWYEITLCISNHRDDTKIDKRAVVDAYTGKVKE